MATAAKRGARVGRVDRRTRAARAEGRAGRDELLSAALKVFARRGYKEAGVDEIAAEAGYSKGALYWHFSGKEDLLMALIEERIDRPMRELVALLESAPADQDMSVEASREFARRMGSVRRSPATRRCPPALKPCSRVLTGCVSVSTSTRR